MSSIRGLDNEFSGLFQGGTAEQRDDNGGSRDNASNFMRVYGWIYQATLIAEHEKIKLEDVYNLQTLQALNDLAYLTSKNAYDTEQMKKVYAKH